MNRKELLETELKGFVDEIKRNYQPEKVILFGSLAAGRSGENSDLDVVVVANSKDDFWTRLQKVSGLCSRKVGMDVLIYTPEEFLKLVGSRQFFKKEIVEKGKVLYDKAGPA